MIRKDFGTLNSVDYCAISDVIYDTLDIITIVIIFMLPILFSFNIEVNDTGPKLKQLICCSVTGYGPVALTREAVHDDLCDIITVDIVCRVLNRHYMMLFMFSSIYLEASNLYGKGL